ncbi:MAG: YtxH domain-containing protein [Ruminococcus sp.]|nr:YtxH domain-containing protein [Ruminococcus sp.]
MLDTCKEIFSLMCDMAEEGLEKARIKAQQNRIREIIRIDEKELESVYAKIGRIDVLGTGKEKRAELIESAKKIEARILRAEVRLQMLKNAASVDECTRAFEEKLIDTVENVRQSATDKAKDLKEIAKEKGSELKEKIKDASVDLTAKAEDLTIKAKDKATDLSIKAKEKSNEIKEKLPKNAPKAVAEELNADSKVLDNVDDILKRIEDTINSVDEESADEFKF